MAKGRLPTIILTGASGFIGRHFIEAAREHFKIYAMARRSQREVGVADHENLEWIIIDLTDGAHLARQSDRIRALGGADFIVHLAGYYDFANVENPAYELSNVVTTRHMLEQAERLKIKRFILASSLVVSDFAHGRPEVITESSPANAEFPYARSKREAERLVSSYEGRFPCSIVRLAAVFSDWCEYGPLYMLLTQWFSGRWDARILAGRGEAAIPYFHVNCAVRTMIGILEFSQQLKDFDIYAASPKRSIAVKEIFAQGTRLFFGSSPHAILLPKPLAASGLVARDLLGRALDRRPFERPWMARYIDRRMDVDPSYTRRAIPVALRRRLLLDRRLPFLVENLKSYPEEFHARNARALARGGERPNIIVTGIMRREREALVERVFEHIRSVPNTNHFPNYQRMAPEKLRWYIRLVYDLLMSSVRSGERSPILSHARYIASARNREGFPAAELKRALADSAEIVTRFLRENYPEECSESFLNDNIRLATQLAIDEVEDTYEMADATSGSQPEDLSAPFL